MAIPDIRKEHTAPELTERDVDSNPFKQFATWLQAAIDARLPLPDAMTLATATRDGIPSARMLMLRGFDEQGFVFYTNYESQKGRELAENPRAALVFYWAPLDRQIRIDGDVRKVSREESDHYFQSRPRDSRLAAWASQQSEVIGSREALEERFRQLQVAYEGSDVPLPPFWGGYRLSPTLFEFWQSRPNRLHDRLRYTRRPDGSWLVERLAP